MNLDKQIIEHRDELIKYFMRRTNQNSELSNDLYQDLFIKVRKTIKNGNYIEDGKLLHWLNRIAKNLIIDNHRKNSRMKLVRPNNDIDIFKFLEADNEEYADTWVTDGLSKRLKEAIKKLPKKQQELIDMRYFRNMSYKEIVKETGEKQNNLLPRMFYAMKKLKKELC